MKNHLYFTNVKYLERMKSASIEDCESNELQLKSSLKSLLDWVVMFVSNFSS
jgi:hypothetical protein